MVPAGSRHEKIVMIGFERLRFVLEWTCATALGLVIAEVVIEILWSSVLGYTMLFLAPLAGGLLRGVPVAVGQWLVLRRHVPDGRRWMEVSILGFIVAWIAAMTVGAALSMLPSSNTVSLFAMFALSSPIAGLFQSVGLRRWNMRTQPWLVASSLGWTCFVGVVIFLPRSFSPISRAAARLIGRLALVEVSSDVGSVLLGAIVAGAITGIVMARLVFDAMGVESVRS